MRVVDQQLFKILHIYQSCILTVRLVILAITLREATSIPKNSTIAIIK